MNLRLHSHEFLFPANFLWISDCIPMSSYLPVNESQTAFPWVPIHPAYESQTAFHEFLSPLSVPVNLRMHPMSSYSLPMNLGLHSHESLFHCQWISRLHSHEFLFHCQIFGVFWLGTTHVLPSCFKRSHRDPKKLHSGAILGVPLYIPHGYP